MKDIFKELIADTESYARVNKDNPTYEKIIKNVNNLLTKYNNIVKSRSSEKRKDRPEMQEDSFPDL